MGRSKDRHAILTPTGAKMFEFYKKLAKYKISIIIGALFLTSIFAFFLAFYPQIKINTDLRSLIPPSAKEDKLTKERDNFEYLVVAFEEIEGVPLFSKEVLETIEMVIYEITDTTALEVAFSPFQQVKISPVIVNGKTVTFEPEGLLKFDPNSHDNLPFAIEDDEMALRFKEDLLNNFISRRLIINEEGTMLALLLDYSKEKSLKTLPDRLSSILSTHNKLFGFSIAGTPQFEKYIGTFLVTDLGLLLGLGILLSLVLFFISFKYFRAVFVTLSVILMSIICMLGAMALIGIEISVVSIVAPPLILALTSSYCIHTFNQYHQHLLVRKTEENRAEQIFVAIYKVAPTILMANATTIIALLGLLVTKIPQTRLFAISTSIGLAFGALFSLTFLPALLACLKAPKVKTKGRRTTNFIATILKKGVPGLIRGRYIILAFLILILAAPLVTTHFLSYESDYVAYFPEDNPAVIEAARISKNFTGITQLYIDFSINNQKLKEWGKENNTATQNLRTFYHNEELLRQIHKFEQTIEQSQYIRYLISFPKMLAETNYVMEGTREIPSDLIQRLRLDSIFKTMRSSNAMAFEFINPQANKITTTIRVSDLTNAHGYLAEETLGDMLDSLNHELSQILPSYVDFVVDGYRVDFIDLRTQMNTDLFNSTLLSSILIFLTITVALRSAYCGLYSLIPMLVGVCLNQVVMVITGIPMDMTTVMVSSVAIGIGVDDAIHFLLTFRNCYEKAKSEDRLREALEETMEEAGRPIIITSVSIILGLGMMVYAQFTPVAYFGTLIAGSLFFATIACLVFLPAMISIRYRAKEKRERKRALKRSLATE